MLFFLLTLSCLPLFLGIRAQKHLGVGFINLELFCLVTCLGKFCIPVWVFCKSLFKSYHLFSLLGNQSLLFFGCAVQKNIKQIFDVAFSLQGFHEQRMPFVLRLLRCVLPFPCSQVMEVIGQHLEAPVFFLLILLLWCGFS